MEMFRLPDSSDRLRTVNCSQWASPSMANLRAGHRYARLIGFSTANMADRVTYTELANVTWGQWNRFELSSIRMETRRARGRRARVQDLEWRRLIFNTHRPRLVSFPRGQLFALCTVPGRFGCT